MTPPQAQSSNELLRFGSDIGLRDRNFVKATMAHPAKCHLGLLGWVINRYTNPGETICDPMAGVGSILIAAHVQRNVIAREIEPRWLDILNANAERVRAQSLFTGEIDTGQSDAREAWGYQADHVIFSPPYANRASTNTTSRHYVSHKTYKMAQEQGVSYTERWHQFVNNPSPDAAGAMTFFYGVHPGQVGAFRNDAYWQAMSAVYTRAYEALRGGYMVLVIKDHIRDGKRVHVCDQTVRLCEELGFVLVERHARYLETLSLWQRKRAERGQPVVREEEVLAFRKSEPKERTMPEACFEGYFEDDKHAIATFSIGAAVELWTRKHPERPVATVVLVSAVDRARYVQEGAQAVGVEVRVSERVRPGCYFGGVE